MDIMAMDTADDLPFPDKIADLGRECVNFAAHDRANTPSLVFAYGQLARGGNALGNFLWRHGGNKHMPLLLLRLIKRNRSPGLVLAPLFCRLPLPRPIL